jgi:hypothetical protein
MIARKMLVLVLAAMLGACAPGGALTGSGLGETRTVDGHTVNITLRGDGPSPTLLYIPGCSGLDNWGSAYQRYHLGLFAQHWPGTNVVISQFVNDITQGSVDGRCDWPGTDTRLARAQSWTQARHSMAIARWIKDQPWSNGEVHALGFSWGGRVGLWLPADRHGEAGVFRSIALVWPDCRSAERFNAGRLHTPVRIYAAREDPLSMPTNCPGFYEGDRGRLSSLLFPGAVHSWMTGASFRPYQRYWPHQQVWVYHAPMPEWTEQMMRDWRAWALANR